MPCQEISLQKRKFHLNKFSFLMKRCGHCRAFAPFYLEFASSIRQWKNVVTAAAINCADVVNQKICSDEGIIGYPMILVRISINKIFMNENLENFGETERDLIAIKTEDFRILKLT